MGELRVKRKDKDEISILLGEHKTMGVMGIYVFMWGLPSISLLAMVLLLAIGVFMFM